MMFGAGKIIRAWPIFSFESDMVGVDYPLKSCARRGPN